MEGYRPIAALGVLSSAAYQPRRQLMRMTWLRSEELERSHSILARFVIALPEDVPIPRAIPAATIARTSVACPDMKRNEKEPIAAALAEAASHGDITFLHTNVSSSRVWSPLHTTWRWFLYATQHHPFDRAHFIAKMDDDVYLHVPELTAHLQQVRRTHAHPLLSLVARALLRAH